MDLQDKIRQTGTAMGTEFAERTTPEGPQPLAPQLPEEKEIIVPGDYTTATRLRK
jgi:hypothetical protein